jgi:O-antigen/teichoic acid export membrane protein
MDVHGAADADEAEERIEVIVEPEPLLSPDVGLKVVRGGTIRGAGYALGMLFTAVASVLLLRHLGVRDFGRYATVSSLVAIVAAVTDAGLSAVGTRDLALRTSRADRRVLLANMLGLRLVVTPLGVVGATLFAVAAGYDRTLVLGTILAGIAIVLSACQTTMTLPLSVDLRIGRLTTLEVLKLGVIVAAIGVVVASGAGLLAIFGVSIVGGLATLAFVPSFVGEDLVWRPSFEPSEWRILIRETLPLAAAVVMGVLYFRILLVVMSLLADAMSTGLFATSFRVVEVLYGLSALVVTTALPVLAAAHRDRLRLGYILQRMSEVALIASSYLVIVVTLTAAPVLDFLGGSQYRAAAPILKIQIFALIPVFLAHVWQFGLISIRRQKALALADGLALMVVLGVGTGLVISHEAKGAAVAAVVGESAFAVALLALLVRADRDLAPSFKFVWKIAAASGLAAGITYLSGWRALPAAALATAAYAFVLWLTRAIPAEVLGSLSLRRLQ